MLPGKAEAHGRSKHFKVQKHLLQHKHSNDREQALCFTPVFCDIYYEQAHTMMATGRDRKWKGVPRLWQLLTSRVAGVGHCLPLDWPQWICLNDRASTRSPKSSSPSEITWYSRFLRSLTKKALRRQCVDAMFSQKFLSCPRLR